MKIQAIGRSIYTYEETNQRATDIYDLFKERIKDFKTRNPQTDLQFTISGEAPYLEVFVIGNKKAGSDYDMQMWKKVPIYACQRQSYTDGSGYWLFLSINFRGSSSSDDGHKYDEIALTQKIDSAILNAVKDFIQSPSNTL